MSPSEYAGPLNFAVFAIPAHVPLTAAAAELRRLAAEGRAEILDVELVAKTPEGHARRTPLPTDLATAETDLLHDEDLADIAADLADDELGLVVVYEDRTLAALAGWVTAEAGRELWVGGIDPADLDEQADDGEDTEDTEDTEDRHASTGTDGTDGSDRDSGVSA